MIRAVRRYSTREKWLVGEGEAVAFEAGATEAGVGDKIPLPRAFSRGLRFGRVQDFHATRLLASVDRVSRVP
jgi:hypothetical protein